MSVEDQDRLLAEIKSGEAWLAEVMRNSPEPRCRALGSVKHRIHIAVHEETVSLPSTPGPSPAAIDRVKRSVRLELDGRREVVSPKPWAVGAWWWRNRYALTTLAAAAAVAFCLTPLFWVEQQPLQHAAVVEFDIFADTLAAASADDFELELIRLEEEIEEFGDSFALPTDLSNDLEIEELEDDVDRLLIESAMPQDV